MMGLLRRLRIRSAAKRYALRLGHSLHRNFGPASTYTPKQIQRSVSDCGLDPRYIVFAYAAFLPEAEFDARFSEMAVTLPYEHARDLYFRFVPSRAGPIIRNVQELGDIGGGPGGGHDGGD